MTTIIIFIVSLLGIVLMIMSFVKLIKKVLSGQRSFNDLKGLMAVFAGLFILGLIITRIIG